MTFLTSRDTIAALMGPAVRTVSPNEEIMSPRQRQLRAMRRSSNESIKSNSSGSSSAPTTPPDEAPALATLDVTHPQDLFFVQQHCEQIALQQLQELQLTARHMHSSADNKTYRGRKASHNRRASRNKSSVALAPVIEVASPTEEKSYKQVWQNFSRPQPVVLRSASVTSSSSTSSSTSSAPSEALSGDCWAADVCSALHAL
ncbi:hypothetical protein PYCC9005_003529 [Savitreella phatthalungensis]